METTIINTAKRFYTEPSFEIIKLDSEISLALMSYPEDPGDMGKNEFAKPDCFTNEPFRAMT